MLASIATVFIVAMVSAVASRALSHERGPFGVFADIRRLINVVLGDGVVASEVKLAWGCPYCLSVWWCMGLHLALFQGAITWIVRVFVSVGLAWLFIAAWRLGDPDDNPPGLIWALYRKVAAIGGKPQ